MINSHRDRDRISRPFPSFAFVPLDTNRTDEVTMEIVASTK